MKPTDSNGISRRRLLAMGGLSTGAAVLGQRLAFANPEGNAQSGANAGSTANTSFAPLKQIDAGLLNVGYAEDGPPDGSPVILLQGWPYDIYSYVDVAPLLAAKGYRVIVPFLRGYGTTHFLSADTFRNGQPYVVALDIINLMDALKIQKAILAGFDWGGRTADIIAILWPDRCKALVSVSGYLIASPAANKAPLPPKAELQW
jgi:pimeloyl-ACP methyl ester carboxylesterase